MHAHLRELMRRSALLIEPISSLRLETNMLSGMTERVREETKKSQQQQTVKNKLLEYEVLLTFSII